MAIKKYSWPVNFTFDRCDQRLLLDPYSTNRSVVSVHAAGDSCYSDVSHLTLAAQARLLQPRPDALDASGVFGVCVCVSTHALVLLHERVIHQT